VGGAVVVCKIKYIVLVKHNIKSYYLGLP